MPSRTSFFNKTVYRKDLTRFAPVWGGYLLCLLVGLMLIYTDGSRESVRAKYLIVQHFAELPRIMAVVNLLYAPLTAQLLFGDLYTARMSHMLHALPLRRENWFFTHVAAGLTFSLVPTAVAALVMVPMASGSIVAGAGQTVLAFFLSSNLEYLCYFGLSVFSAMCVGNRFTMAAVYGLLNAGAYLAYLLVDMVYTPMLYGVITPTVLVMRLTPVAQMVDDPFLSVTRWSQLVDDSGKLLPDAGARVTVDAGWDALLLWAAAGAVLLVLALVLYRRRNLECAGDAVAFPCLVPVFQILCALSVMVAGQAVVYLFLGLYERKFLVLGTGLVAGWFIGKMLLERTTRVFRLKNWAGLGALAAVLALTMVLTHFDVLGIETRVPQADRVVSVSLDGIELTEPEDIDAMIRLQQLAVREPLEESGTYLRQTDGSRVSWSTAFGSSADAPETADFVYASTVNLHYILDNGNEMDRRYILWTDSEAGAMVNAVLNRWENVDSRTISMNGREIPRLPYVLENFDSLHVGYYPGVDKKSDPDNPIFRKEVALELVEALRADADQGHLAQNPLFHTGHFIHHSEEYAEKGYGRTDAIYLGINGKNYSWGVTVFADSTNTLQLLEKYGLLRDVTVSPANIRMW